MRTFNALSLKGCLLLVSVALLPRAFESFVLSSSQASYVIDVEHGCSVSGAWAAGDPAKTNLINTADLGRYVQASYYAGPQPYDGCFWRDSPWPWNPISAGDCKGNPARVLSSGQLDAQHASCEIVPMQWACNNCTITFNYTLTGSTLMASVTLNNDRADHTQYGISNQEIPAVYVNAFLDNLVAYTGNAPCTGQALTSVPSGWNDAAPDPWIPGTMTYVTEPWVAFTQPDGFGLGVWSVDANAGFKAGFFGTKGKGGTKDSSTGYMAPLSNEALAWNASYTYRYALIMGNLPDIRSVACSLK